MTLNLIILGFASILALYWTFRNPNWITTSITIGLIIGIIFAFLKIGLSIVLGVNVFLVFSAVGLLYALFFKAMPYAKRLVLLFTILPVFLYWFFSINHLAGAHWLFHGLYLPFIFLVYALARPISLKKEWGIVFIMLAEAFSILFPIYFK
jgi:hypothetical protein